VDLYFLDEETASIYSHLKAAVFNQFAPKDKSKRRNVSIESLGFGDHDLWIAATAIQHDSTLVSADSDFQRIYQVNPFSFRVVGIAIAFPQNTAIFFAIAFSGISNFLGLNTSRFK